MTSARAGAALAACAMLPLAGVGQGASDAGKVQWLQENAVMVRDLDARSEDFSDLMPLVGAIGDAQVVMLGEQTHMDGTTLLAKDRLVRFLHQVMGFDVLVWESGFYDCSEVDAAMRDPRQSALQAANKGIFGIWTNSEQVRPLLEYVKATQQGPRPIETAGMDGQFTAQRTNYAHYLIRFVDRVSPGLLTDAERRMLRERMRTLKLQQYRPGPGESAQFRAVLRRLSEAGATPPFRNAYAARELAFFQQSIVVALHQEAVLNPAPDGAAGKTPRPTRDEGMAATLDWLARERYAGRKLIVWAASAHTSYRVLEPPDGDFRPMGSYAKQLLGGRIYSLGFIAYQGHIAQMMAGYPGGPPTDILDAPEGTLEHMLHAAGAPLAFVDLKSLPVGHWLRGRVRARPYGHAYVFDGAPFRYSRKEEGWPEHFDAFFFTDVMTPSTLVSGNVAPEPRATALVGANVIDGSGAPRSARPWTVVVRGDRIEAAGPDVDVPADAAVIDLAGRTLLPGLIDMHAHFFASVEEEIRNVFEAYAPLYLAGGVTTARSPGDFDPEATFAYKQRLARAEAPGPRLLMGGYYIDHKPARIKWFDPIATPQEAADRIERWRDRIDVVKFYGGVTDAELRAGIETARRLGIPTTAHLGSITAGRAIELGINGLEHGLHGIPELLRVGAAVDPDCPLGALDLESPAVRSLIDSIVKHRVALTPTFVMTLSGLPAEPLTPGWREYMGSAQVAAAAEPDAPQPERHACLVRTREKALRFVRKVHERGGLVLAGTDPVWPYLLPGWALHRELKYLTDAGLTPLQAIRAATHDSAVALRREKDLGRIAPGMLADMVVVSGDPSRRIEDIGTVEMVFKDGQRFDPRALRAQARGKIR